MTDKHIVVVGAGLMGTGITHAFLASGHHVTLVDTQATALDKARQSIDKIFSDGVRLGKVSAADVTGALARMTCADRLQAASGDGAGDGDGD